MMLIGTIRGYVLAGGGSTRFGQDKALIEVNGQPILLRMQRLLASVVTDVAVIASPEKYASFGVSCIPDLWLGQGPLAGIITALRSSAAATNIPRWNLIIGCDMPFLSREWLAHLAKLSLASDVDVLVPRSISGLEPLCACWRTNAADQLQKEFDSGTRKITDAMEKLRMEIVDEPDWKRFDTAGRLFWNMNTPKDYEEARRLLNAEHA
jgi:molybdenum cofactor guanylyltransferase